MLNLNQAIKQLQSGGLVIIQDDKDRENEGDLVCNALLCSAENINFMISHGKGMVCLAMPYKKIQSLALNLQTKRGNNPFDSAFTDSIDAATGITTGISASDRAITIRTAAAEDCQPHALCTPGHIFPLQAHPEGLVKRQGHTEASVALMQLANLSESAVICEVLKKDGTMARTEALNVLSEQFSIPLLSIREIKHAFLNTTESV